jgi:hypothetical protein
MSPAQTGARPGAAPRSRPVSFLSLAFILLVSVITLVIPPGRADALARP